MAPPMLNSNHQAKIYVKESQSSPAEYDESESFPVFSIKRQVSVKFISDNELSQDKSFEVLSMEDESYFVFCHQVNSGSTTTLEFIADMLYNDKFIPFDFDRSMWRERHLNSSITNEAKSCCSLLNKRSLLEKIRDFLLWMKLQQHNADKNILPVNLEIRKMVVVPDEEFKTLNSWFDEKKRCDPNFEKDFQQAVGIEIEQNRGRIEFLL